VIRGGDGDFYLEGGAMVLADGGCVCIERVRRLFVEAFFLFLFFRAFGTSRFDAWRCLPPITCPRD
jgi:hypothetical protein